MAKDQEMTVLAWSPLRGGVLTGKHLTKDPANADSRYNSDMMKGFVSTDDATVKTVRAVVALAKEMEITPAQVALAWLRHRPVPVIPIIGARKMTQLEDNLKSLAVTLTAGQLRRLDEASAVSMGFPHDFFAMEMVRNFAYGGFADRIKTNR